jgi:hypothetical protein
MHLKKNPRFTMIGIIVAITIDERRLTFVGFAANSIWESGVPSSHLWSALMAPLVPFGYANTQPRIVLESVEIKQVIILTLHTLFIMRVMIIIIGQCK